MLHSLLHSSHETERTVSRQRSHQLWPTKHCRVVRKYWTQTRHRLVRSLAPRDLLQCSACDCVGGVRLGTESLVIRDSVQTLCCACQRPCHYSLLINASLASCWYQHRFRTLLRSPRIFSWHGFSNYFFWYLHADTVDLATRSGQNLKSPGWVHSKNTFVLVFVIEMVYRNQLFQLQS